MNRGVFACAFRFFAVFCGFLRAKTGNLNEFLLFLSIKWVLWDDFIVVVYV